MSGLGLGLGLGLGAQSRAAQKDMILVYEIPDPNTNIELAIQANSTWFSAGQAVVINWGDGSANDAVSNTGGSTYIGHISTISCICFYRTIKILNHRCQTITSKFR